MGGAGSFIALYLPLFSVVRAPTATYCTVRGSRFALLADTVGPLTEPGFFHPRAIPSPSVVQRTAPRQTLNVGVPVEIRMIVRKRRAAKTVNARLTYTPQSVHVAAAVVQPGQETKKGAMTDMLCKKRTGTRPRKKMCKESMVSRGKT